MLDKIYIFIALVVGIIITIVMLLGEYTAIEWATATFWSIVAYLLIGLVLRMYLKKKVFYEPLEPIIDDESDENDENEEDDDKLDSEDVKNVFADE